MPEKKTIVTTRKETTQNEDGNGTTPETGKPGDDDQPDQFATLFLTDGDQSEVRVTLRRTSPKGVLPDAVTGTEVQLTGFLEDLPPGLSSYEQYVRDRYGGGTYLASRMVKNERGQWQFGGNKQVEIGGIPPKIVTATAPSTLEGGSSEPALTPDPTGGAIVDVNGVQVPLSIEYGELESLALKIKAIRMLFPDPPQPVDPNPLLLEMLREKQTPDPSQMFESLGSIVGVVKDLIGEGGGGTDIMGVINNAIATVGKLADKSAPASPPRPGQIPASLTPSRQLPASAQTESNEQIPAEEIETMTFQQQAQVAISNLTAGYTLDPPMEVADMVEALDNVLDLGKETRAVLGPHKKQLWNLARLTLSQHFAELPGGEAGFENYFNDVFDSYVDLQREVKPLGT